MDKTASIIEARHFRLRRVRLAVDRAVEVRWRSRHLHQAKTWRKNTAQNHQIEVRIMAERYNNKYRTNYQ